MFLELKLKNVKKHVDTVVNFTDGVNTIQGPNYRGKSSLLYGCLLAMFGPSPLPGKASDIATAGSNGRWYAGLTFLLEGRVIKVERTTSTATLTALGQHGAEDQILATGPAVVTSEVEKLVGMSAKRFCELRYAEQKKAEVMLTLNVNDVHKIIEEVGGVSLVNDVIRVCAKRITELDGKMEGLQLDPELTTLQLTKVQELERRPAVQPGWLQDIEAKRALALEQDERIEKARSVLRDIEAKFEQIRQWQQTLDAAAGTVNTRKQDIEAAQASLEAAKHALALADAGGEWAKQDTLAASLARDLEEADTAIRELRSLNDQLTGHRDNVTSLVKRKQLAEASLETLPEAASEAQTAELQGTLTQLTEKRAGMRQERDTAVTALESGFCKSCKRPFEGMNDDHAAELRALVERVAAELPALDRQIQQAEKAIEAAQTAARSRASAEATLATCTTGLQEAEEKLRVAEVALTSYLTKIGLPETSSVADLQEIRRSISASLAESQQAGNRFRQMAEQVARADQQVKAAGISLETAEAVLARASEGRPEQAGDWQTVQANANAAIVEATEIKARASQEATSMEEARTLTLETLASERRLLDSYQRRVEESQQVAKDLAMHKGLVDYLRKNRDRFVGELWDGIMAYTQNFASACTGGAIEAVKREGDGSFSYTENGHTFSVKGCASGAQKSIMGLGVQFALAEMLPTTMQTVLLDEPSADMDAEHSAALATLLRSTGKQVILVSHREMDAAVSDNVITL